MRSPSAIDPAKALAIVELRHKRLTQARIAAALGVSKSTVSRVLSRAGLSLLSNLDPVEAIVRYEHEAPGNMLHIDMNRPGFELTPRSWTNFKGSYGEVRDKVQARGR
jgi:transcriptional regulator with XRE-family HTH domain